MCIRQHSSWPYQPVFSLFADSQSWCLNLAKNTGTPVAGWLAQAEWSAFVAIVGGMTHFGKVGECHVDVVLFHAAVSRLRQYLRHG